MKKLSCLIALLLSAAAAPAATISFSSSFGADDDVAIFAFSLAAPGTVTLRTFSYAGGVNGAGATISAGGFDPVVSLYDSAGLFIDLNDDGLGLPVDAVTGQAYDAELMIALAAGSYQVALTQFDNLPLGDLLDGFFFTGDPAFTAFFGCSNGMFCDDTGADRSSSYALDISGVDAPAGQIPEPSTLLLLGSALSTIALRRRRRLTHS